MAQMSRSEFDRILELCSKNAVYANDADGESNDSYVTISLSENPDIRKYNNAYSEERSKVEAIINSVSTTPKENETELVVPMTKKCVVSCIEDLSNVPNISYANGNSIFIPSKLKDTHICNISSSSIKEGKHEHHYFYIQDCLSTKLISLTVTTIYRGEFVGTSYVPGKITIGLRRLSYGNEPIMASDAVPQKSNIDPWVYHEQLIPTINLHSPNTKDEIGRIVVQHKPERATIDSGLFEINVLAERNANFSITISGSFACEASTELKREHAQVLANTQESFLCSQTMVSLQTNMQIIERKIRIEENLVKEARARCDRCEMEIEKLDVELDGRDDMDDNGTFIIERIKVLEAEYDHFFSLFTLR